MGDEAGRPSPQPRVQEVRRLRRLAVRIRRTHQVQRPRLHHDHIQTCSGDTARKSERTIVVFVSHCHIRSIIIISASRRYIPRRRHRKPCGSTGVQVNMVSPSPPFEIVSYQNEISWLQSPAFIPSFVSHSGEPVAPTNIRILSCGQS